MFLTSTQSARIALADMIDTSGMAPWEVCGLCHSLDGISPMAKFPKLAGQRAAYIEKQIRDFHGNRRSNDGGQMQAITTEVDLAELSEIAAYFASLPAPPPAPLEEKGTEQAEILFALGRGPVPACLSCHGKTDPGLPLAPWLEAQHADYLAKQLTDFKNGDRTNDPGEVMRAVAAQLSDDEIKALSAFIAGRERPERTP
ncbi:c-type cytochrome [Roseibium salinum]|uniref:C-type cytochrome n=1 Tax=Roseibium salinum TaxID=1604349 RepID=A0ABT3QVS1_9HYPH|nr:c-type cytochrome [Roseibium sp. DSM 29163]MCX2720956.1 c-type cytochrome [Roseibium sp. DSM 29163]